MNRPTKHIVNIYSRYSRPPPTSLEPNPARAQTRNSGHSTPQKSSSAGTCHPVTAQQTAPSRKQERPPPEYETAPLAPRQSREQWLTTSQPTPNRGGRLIRTHARTREASNDSVYQRRRTPRIQEGRKTLCGRRRPRAYTEREGRRSITSSPPAPPPSGHVLPARRPRSISWRAHAQQGGVASPPSPLRRLLLHHSRPPPPKRYNRRKPSPPRSAQRRGGENHQTTAAATAGALKNAPSVRTRSPAESGAATRG